MVILASGKLQSILSNLCIFADVVSKENRLSVLEQKNKKESIRRLVSGEILRKYKLIKYASAKTGNNCRKVCWSKRKILYVQAIKHRFVPKIHAEVLRFYACDDNSTALPGKRDAKQMKKVQIQKRSLNDYLSNLYLNIKAEQSNLKLSFATFAKMQPSNYVLANFKNRQSGLCKKHQNVTLKLKMLKNYNNCPDQSWYIYQNIFFRQYQKTLWQL